MSICRLVSQQGETEVARGGDGEGHAVCAGEAQWCGGCSLEEHLGVGVGESRHGPRNAELQESSDARTRASIKASQQVLQYFWACALNLRKPLEDQAQLLDESCTVKGVSRRWTGLASERFSLASEQMTL
jgi:hypothetical protein